MATFAENLRQFMAYKGINSTKFAGACNINCSAMSNYTSGLRIPDGGAVSRMLDAFPDLSADFLFGRNVPMILGSNESVSAVVEEMREDEKKEYLMKIDSQQKLIKILMDTVSERDKFIQELLQK